MKIRIVYLIVTLFAAIGVCRADSIVFVELGGSSTARYNAQAGTHSVLATFDWNTLTSSVVPGTMSVTSYGLISDNVFFYTGWSMFAIDQPQFLFENASSDIFQIILFPNGSRLPDGSFSGPVFPSPSLYGGETNVICGSPTDDCSYYGLGGLNLGRATATVVAVPEPETPVLSLTILAVLAMIMSTRVGLVRLIQN